ncbi:uncharacterized protein DS421_18g615200 [Arachis hypogaea]|nr:uncharacterized protein DS421_18g615200 [Arachis hypogaea]
MQSFNIDFHIQDTIKLYKLEIMLDIILGHKNSTIGEALNALDSRPQPAVRRNQPRNKHKEVRTPYNTWHKEHASTSCRIAKEKAHQNELNMRRKKMHITFLFT